MKKLTLMLVTLAMTASWAAAQSPASDPTPTAQQSGTDGRQRLLQEIVVQVQKRLFARIVERRTGGTIVADVIGPGTDGEVYAGGNVTLTFQGGVITAEEVTIANDGTIRILGDSRVKLTVK